MTAHSLDNTILKFGDQSWTTRQAVEGVQIFGGIGSGKTSGSGRTLALKLLSAGFGGLVLTAKPDEKELWDNYCKQTGRENDLLIVGPSLHNYFNFLEYEAKQGHHGNSITENIVEVLKTVIRASEEKSTGKSDDPFWESALDMLIFHVIDLCKLAYGKVSVELMFGIVQSLPKAGVPQAGAEATAYQKAYEAAERNVTQQIENWQQQQSHETLNSFQNNDALFNQAVSEALPDARLLRYLHEFFTDSYMNLAEKTRSIIDFSFSGFLFRLLREPVHSLFCRYPSTFTPEDCQQGKIILINLPVKIYHKIGRDCQIMFKYIWQRAMERRSVKINDRPVFLWADEAQNFLHEHDADYQATARSSRIATVYITQNLPNYHSNMGGTKSDSRVKSFLGTLGTKIFHANADIETNRYASELIGEAYFEDISRTATAAGQFSSSKTNSVKLERVVRPEDFMRLKTGGPANGFQVEGFVHLQGNFFKEKVNHLKVRFNQNT